MNISQPTRPYRPKVTFFYRKKMDRSNPVKKWIDNIYVLYLRQNKLDDTLSNVLFFSEKMYLEMNKKRDEHINKMFIYRQNRTYNTYSSYRKTIFFSKKFFNIYQKASQLGILLVKYIHIVNRNMGNIMSLVNMSSCMFRNQFISISYKDFIEDTIKKYMMYYRKTQYYLDYIDFYFEQFTRLCILFKKYKKI